MRTSALLSRDPRAPFELAEVRVDEPLGTEILVRIAASGVCHTDLISRAAGAADRPVLLGHEGAGIVEAVGDAVTDVRPGDRVVLTFRHCGRCPNCLADRPAYCRRATALNNFGRRAEGGPRVTLDGAPVLDGFFGQSSLAGYALATEDNTVVVEPETDLALAAPLGCGFQTGAGAVLNVLAPAPGAQLVIYGAGAVGMAALLAARALDDVAITVVETSAARRALALELGAQAALDPAETDIPPAVRDLTGGGATHALETTGIPAVLGGAVAALATGATVVAVGLGQGVPPVDLGDLVLNGKSIRGCLEGDSIPQVFIPRLLRWHREGRLPLERLVTTFPYAEIEAALAAQRAGEVVKPVLTW